MVPTGKAKRLLLINHTTKTIHSSSLPTGENEKVNRLMNNKLGGKIMKEFVT